MRPELVEENVQAALLTAVERELVQDDESLWWRSGLEELDSGPAPKQAWGDSGVVEA
jgi:hypothetical protein